MKGGLAQSIVTVFLFAIVSKSIGFVRDIVYAAYFGVTSGMDALVLAELFPGIVGDLALYAIPSIFIPVYQMQLKKHGVVKADAFSDSFLSIVLITTGFFSTIYFLFPDYINFPFISGNTATKRELITDLSRILAPITFLYGLLGFALAKLQAHHHYRALVFSSFPLNLVSIFVVMGLGRQYGIYAGAWAMSLGLLAQVTYLWYLVLKSCYRPNFRLNINDIAWVPVSMQSLLAFIIVGSTISNPYIDRYLASNLVDGSVSALNFATRINGAFFSIFVASLTTVMFPNFSQELISGNLTTFCNQFVKSFFSLMFVAIPLIMFVFIFSKPIVQTLLERGAFGASATDATSHALMFFSIGLIGTALNELLTKAYFAAKKTVIPAMVAIGVLVCKVSLSIVLVKYMTHGGLALATSIAVSLGSLVLLFDFVRRYNLLICGSNIGKSLLKILISSVFAVIIGWCTYIASLFAVQSFVAYKNSAAFISLIIAGTFGAFGYLTCAHLFKCEQLIIFKRLIKERWLSLTNKH